MAFRTLVPCLLLAAPPAAVLAGAVPAAPGFAAARLEPAEFARLHAAVQPGRERWAEIPWQTDLREARETSARLGKPLFMWVMDGHPLGCT